MYTTIRIDKELVKSLKIYAIRQEMLLQELVEKFLREGYKKATKEIKK